MESQRPYVDALSASIPSVLSDCLLHFDTDELKKLETLVRFCSGGTCPPRISKHADSWDNGQTRLRARLSQLDPEIGIGAKRAREGDDDGAAPADASAITNGHGTPAPGNPQKKQKLALIEEALPGEDKKTLYTLHSLSVSAPIRKKVDIALTPDALRLTNPSTGALEARIPLSYLTRAFLVSSLGKNKAKPQWAITMLSVDSIPGKKGAADAVDAVQVAFAVDKTVPGGKDAFRTSGGNGAAVEAHAKGTETLPILRAFLAQLAPHIEVLEALGSDAGATGSSNKNTSFASSAGVPYVEAYRGAKEGALAFLPRGILWAGTRPAEYFALEDLAPDADGEEASRGGVKTLSATGRTFTVFVRRRLPRNAHPEEGDEDEDEDEDDLYDYDETEFAMIDGRESENVNAWIRRYRKQFGKSRTAPGVDATANGNGTSTSTTQMDAKGKGKVKAEEAMVVDDDESDASDEDFEEPSDSDGGEPSSDEESGEEGEGGGGEEEEEAEDSDEGAGALEEEEEKLDPAHHPLLRPGAMPKMSRAAMDAAAKMVMGDMVGSEEEEEDELE